MTGSGNLVAGTDPLFVGGTTPTLANNGGAVQTIALQSGSPLINAGSNAALRGVDARGNGFSRTIGAAVDIGSFEFAATAGTPSALATATNVTANGAATYAFSVTYTDVAGTTVGINTGSLGGDDITVTGPGGFSQNASFAGFTGSGGSVTANYTITVPGGWSSASYGTYSIGVNSGAVTDLDGNAVPAGAVGSFRALTPATFTVTNLNDSGAGSLRDAISQANSRALSADSIVFQAGLTGTISLASGLVIADSVSITGPGAASLTLAGNNSFRLIVTAMEGVGVVNLSGMTLTGGATTSANGGGALFIEQDNVTLDGVTVNANSASAGGGGGIAVQRGGTLTIRNSTISGNTSTVARAAYVASAGGINFLNGGGTLDLENSTVTGNNGTNGGGIGDTSFSNFTIRNSNITGNTTSGKGGGFYTIYQATVLVDNSTISSNTAALAGGGIGDRQLGIYTIRNSTVSGNTTNAGGGGGFYMGYNGSADVESSTISGNAAPAFEGGGFYFFGHTTGSGLIFRNSTIAGNSAGTNGGGIDLNNFGFGNLASTLLIQNTTIAGNSAANGGGLADVAPVAGSESITMVSSVIARNTAGTSADVSGTINATNSLVRDQSGATITGTGNLAAGTDPLFVGGATPTLANNGGPRQTIALQSGSPLINAGSNPTNLTGDERGSVGFFRTFGAGTDIGSFEFQGQAATVVNDGTAQRSRVTSLTVTFSAQVTFAGSVGAAFTLTRNSDGAVIGFTATSSIVNGVTTVTLNGFTGYGNGLRFAGRWAIHINRPVEPDYDRWIGAGRRRQRHSGRQLHLYRYPRPGDWAVPVLRRHQRRPDCQRSRFRLLQKRLWNIGRRCQLSQAFDFNGDGVINGFDFGQFRYAIRHQLCRDRATAGDGPRPTD